MARVVPTIRGNIHDAPYSGGRPSLPWAVVNFVSGAANRRSQKQTSERPMPAAAPCTAAIVGLESPMCDASGWSKAGSMP